MSKIIKRHVPCPCGNSSDAYCVWDDGHGYCFSCNKAHGGEEKDLTDDNFTYQHIAYRGVSVETMKKYKVLAKITSSGLPVELGYPYTNGVKVRNLAKKSFWAKGDLSTPGLFGKDVFPAGSAKAITIFEGEHDALSGYEILKHACVSIRGASSAKADITADFDYLDSFEKVYICFDNDKAGADAVKAIKGILDPAKVYIVRLTKYKDCNDFLVNGEAKEFYNLWWSSKRVIASEGILSSFEEFKEILEEELKKPSISYPFPTLQSLSFGIRTGECILFTALEGVGKTEILRAIEYHILKTTQEKLGIIHLEESKSRFLKGLASYELGKPAHLESANVSKEEVLKAITGIVGIDERLFIYDMFGSIDTDNLISTIRYMASKGVRYVFLDHISIVVSGRSDDDERKLLDVLSTQLKMLAQELDIAIIFVSHVNDDLQTRGSRNISKIADLHVYLSRNLEAETEAERNITRLLIKKNRFGGSTGPAGLLLFNPKTFKLEEVKHIQDTRSDRLPT